MNFMKPHKVSTHSANSDNCYLHFFSWLSDWVEILWGFTIFIFKQMLKCWKTKKFYLLTQFSGKVLIQLIRDHFRNGLGAHTYIYDTHDFNGTTAFWLYESFFSSKYSGGNLRLNAQHVRMSVPLSVRMSVRLSVAMIYYIPTYIIHNVEFSAWAFQID